MCIELLMGRPYIFSFAEIVAKLLHVSHSAVFILNVVFFSYSRQRMIMVHLGCVIQSKLNYI